MSNEYRNKVVKHKNSYLLALDATAAKRGMFHNMQREKKDRAC